jgi:hypothetical protein
MAPSWRGLRRHFGIAAPRMAVRTRLPWWGRGAIVLSLLAMIAGMWWWGFDFGQILGGFNRKEIETRLASLEADATRYRTEAAELRAANATLESELAMTRGKQDALSKQATDLTGENAQLKEELAFLQKLVSDSSKTVGLQIQRLDVEPDGENEWRFSILVVRGGSPKDEFVGNVVIRATLAGAPPAESALPAIQIPGDNPEASPALRLKFKYYQRVEGRFRVPQGSRVMSVEVRGYESGQAVPRVTRTLSLG